MRIMLECTHPLYAKLVDHTTGETIAERVVAWDDEGYAMIVDVEEGKLERAIHYQDFSGIYAKNAAGELMG
jgi:hypothetical protein